MSIDEIVDGQCADGTAPCPDIPPRDPHGHKGTFGTVVVVGGCIQLPTVMLGGPVIAARAALRAGCGLVKLAMSEPLLVGALSALESATGVGLPVSQDGQLQPSECAQRLDHALEGADALVVGPGLGGGSAVEQVVARLLSFARVPLVMDADGLNALSRIPHFHLEMVGGGVIMTPHPGEYQRLAEALELEQLNPHDNDSARACAVALAQRVGAVVVLKGSRTVVSDGVQEWSARAGNAALATGGSGDALAGICGSFAAQFHRGSAGLSLFDCARLAVATHGIAARRWSSTHGDAGMLAVEICDEIPSVLASLRSS